ncbi:MAG TPA: hypothetical protein VFQ92_07595, partial [Blastocatellia bacterium]|nr:hypothetical protein [Blastocatellia bacterium]
MQEVQNDSGFDQLSDDRKQGVFENVIEPEKRPASTRSVAWLALGFITLSLVAAIVIIQVAYKRTSQPVPELPAPRQVTSVSLPSPA